VAGGSKWSSSFCMSGWSCIERHYGFFCIRKMSEPDDELLLSACVYEIPGSSKGPWVFGSAKCIIL
jgi:hypothetical protein